MAVSAAPMGGCQRHAFASPPRATIAAWFDAKDNLVAKLELDAPDESVPLATALRKCIVLGGKSGSRGPAGLGNT